MQQDKKTKLEERKMVQGERRDGRELGAEVLRANLKLETIRFPR